MSVATEKKANGHSRGRLLPEDEVLTTPVKLRALVAEQRVRLQATDGEIDWDLPWPAEWPEAVSQAFLEKKGFEVVRK